MIHIRKKIHLLLGLLVALLWIIYQSVLIVPEGYSALLLQSNKLVSHRQGQHLDLKPGLHFKIPFLVQPLLLDNRLQTLTFKESAYSSLAGKPIAVDYYANWRIDNPSAYYQHTQNNLPQVNLLILKQITRLFQNQQASLPLSELILHGPALQLNAAIAAVNKQLDEAGIRIIDIGFKQMQLSAAADAVLLNKMNTEQENMAVAQRANGKANAELIHVTADNSVSLILASAAEEAAKIRAQGDAKAAEIYNLAYHKNPEFASFYLNLQAYQNGFTLSAMDNFLLLNAKNDLLNNSVRTRRTTGEPFKLKT
ncbi:MAG: protein HflC [Pseudomonadota bacterium]|jgi:membrane protease subunit HflC